jgi:hypothetical protein
MNTNFYRFDEAFFDVHKLQTEEDAPLSDHIHKLTEELGEIAESYLMLKSYKDPSRSLPEEEKHLTEEAIDACIVTMAIISKMLALPQISEEFVQTTMKEKVQKWRNKFEKHKLENHT